MRADLGTLKANTDAGNEVCGITIRVEAVIESIETEPGSSCRVYFDGQGDQ